MKIVKMLDSLKCTIALFHNIDFCNFVKKKKKNWHMLN